MLVKPASLIIDGVNQHRPDTNYVRRFFNPLQCIEQERFPKSFSFLGDVYRQASEQDDAYRVVREPFGNSLGALVFVDGTRGERVISDDMILTKAYVGFRRVRLLVQPRKLL